MFLDEEAMLEAQGLEVKLGGGLVVNRASLRLPKGLCIALVGPNGAGKTTLLLALSGLLKPSSGTIRFRGMDITHLPAQKRASIGLIYCPDRASIVKELTVEENLRIAEFSRKRAKALERAYSFFPFLREKRRLMAEELSGGERQMLLLARSLAMLPKVLLLDEPFSGLSKDTIAGLVLKLKEAMREGMGIVIAEHELETIASLCTYAYGMKSGSMVWEGPASQLLKQESIRAIFF